MPPVKTPKRLRNNPLIDVTAEIRFSSEAPRDTIVGLVYGAIKDSFGAPETLPILQLPIALRDHDPNLRYQAYYRFRKQGHSLLLGPRTVALSTIPYEDWDSAEPQLIDILTKLDKVKLFHKIERVGLRYINFFENLNVVGHSTLKVEIAGKSVADQSVSLRTQRMDKDFTVITQIISNASIAVPVKKTGSIIDLDVSTENITTDPALLPNTVLSFFTDANAVADDAFFTLLTADFINQFEPEF